MFAQDSKYIKFWKKKSHIRDHHNYTLLHIIAIIISACVVQAICIRGTQTSKMSWMKRTNEKNASIMKRKLNLLRPYDRVWRNHFKIILTRWRANALRAHVCDICETSFTFTCDGMQCSNTLKVKKKNKCGAYNMRNCMPLKRIHFTKENTMRDYALMIFRKNHIFTKIYIAHIVS